MPRAGLNLLPHDRRLEDDRALSDGEIRAILGISKPTLLRYRKLYGLPGPHFRVGQRSFTWRSAIRAWVAAREAAGTVYQPPMNRDRPANPDERQAATEPETSESNPDLYSVPRKYRRLNAKLLLVKSK